MKTFWSKSCRSTGNSIRTAEEGKKILIKRERNNGLMLYVLSPVSFLFLFCFIGFIGFMVFSRTGLIALQRTLPAFLFFFLFYFSLDRLIAKPEELRITIAPLKCPGFYGMSWIVPTLGTEKIPVSFEQDSVFCKSLGEIVIPAYVAGNQKRAERIARILNRFFTARHSSG